MRLVLSLTWTLKRMCADQRVSNQSSTRRPSKSRGTKRAHSMHTFGALPVGDSYRSNGCNTSRQPRPGNKIQISPGPRLYRYTTTISTCTSWSSQPVVRCRYMQQVNNRYPAHVTVYRYSGHIPGITFKQCIALRYVIMGPEHVHQRQTTSTKI